MNAPNVYAQGGCTSECRTSGGRIGNAEWFSPVDGTLLACVDWHPALQQPRVKLLIDGVMRYGVAHTVPEAYRAAWRNMRLDQYDLLYVLKATRYKGARYSGEGEIA